MNDCWLWAGGIHANGYGYWWDAENKKLLTAHRVVYEALVGNIPKGITLDHLCQNTNCVNPAHLEPVTLKENILRGRGLAARNARKLFCNKGHKLSGENLKIEYGRRRCRECKRAQFRKYYWRKKVYA